MPDTHDERGGDADPYDWDPVYAAATIDRLQKALATETATCKRWLQRTVELGKRADNAAAACEDLRQQLAAATARAEKAEALVAGFGPACCVCGRILGYRNYRDQLFCWPCADGEPKTADAARDGRSEPVERSETSGGIGTASNSRATAAGLSEPELPDRQAKLLAVIHRWGGEWAPTRARTVLVEAGYAVTKERAHQIMKHLAERGYLEQVRPRAYTYRLKAEVQQLDDDTTEDGQHG